MSKSARALDENVRTSIEKTIDRYLENPDEIFIEFSTMLSFQGIEPTLETVLSAISGYMYGRVCAEYRKRFSRALDQPEKSDFNKLMARRAWELRQAYINAEWR